MVEKLQKEIPGATSYPDLEISIRVYVKKKRDLLFHVNIRGFNADLSKIYIFVTETIIKKKLDFFYSEIRNLGNYRYFDLPQ